MLLFHSSKGNKKYHHPQVAPALEIWRTLFSPPIQFNFVMETKIRTKEFFIGTFQPFSATGKIIFMISFKELRFVSFPLLILFFYCFYHNCVVYGFAAASKYSIYQDSSINQTEALLYNKISTQSIETKLRFQKNLLPFTSISYIDSRFANEDNSYSSVPSNVRDSLSEVERQSIDFFVDHYIQYHQKNRYNGSRYLIYFASGAGGLGDRCNILLIAYWLSVLSNRIFIIDWEEPFPIDIFLTNKHQNMNFFYNNDRDPKNFVTTKQKKGENGHNNDIQYLAAIDHNQSSYDRDEEMLMSPTKTVVFKLNRLAPYYSDKFLQFNTKIREKYTTLTPAVLLQLRKNGILRRAIFHNVFSLSKHTTESYISFLKKFGINRSQYIGVHARLGKGVQETKSRFENIVSAQDKVANCLSERAVKLSLISSKSKTKALPIYLATDTPEFRDLFRETVYNMTGGKVKVYSGDWDVVHTKTLYASGSNSFKHETVVNGLLDLAILGHSKHIVALYSSFPRLAQWIGSADSMTELRNNICLS